MEKVTLIEALSQLESHEAGKIFRAFIRDTVRTSYLEVMLEEVSALCGPNYSPDKKSPYYRSGNAPGVCTLDGREERISRPRVRKKNKKGSTEIILDSYRISRNGDEIKRALLRAFSAGVSSRDQKRVYPNVSGISKSSVSRLWVKEGIKCIEKLRNRELSGEKFFGLILDGISLSDDLHAIVALGLTNDGRKLILDFQLGNSESKEVCNDLLKRLVSRGFKTEHRLFSVIDGSRSLRKSLLEYFPDAVIQRCLVHKERNIRKYLPKRYYVQLGDYFRQLRGGGGPEKAREVYKELHNFLSSKNKNALDSLEECGEDLIALHLINAPSSLNQTLLNTNCIENSFLNVRRKIGRVNRWRSETVQAERWLSYSLIEAEKSFRRIKGWRDIPLLIKCLEKLPNPAHSSEQGLDTREKSADQYLNEKVA
ncbi:MAG: transposase [Victivallales bacterium]|nr:transposase [Victivallales bacterium]